MLVSQQHFRTIWSNFPIEISTFTHQAGYVVSIIDQTVLPHTFNIVEIHSLAQMIVAIQSMQVRGAPLIGAAAAYGIALATNESVEDIFLLSSAEELINSRPTAVNLSWSVQRMLSELIHLDKPKRLEAAWREAAKICDEDVNINRAIAKHGLGLIQSSLVNKTKMQKNQINILTHCNAGWLATVDVGTALAPIYAAHDAGLNVHIWVDETRPRNQGASLTAWELKMHGVPHTVISDNAGGHLMQQGRVDMVIVGADRVTRQGDVCNKIGTYLKALAAFDNHIPFYVAVPSPTIDWDIADGLSEIIIEERHGDELAVMRGLNLHGELTQINILPVATMVANPAFDVTPARLVTGIITERGVFTPKDLLQQQQNLMNSWQGAI